MTFQTLFEAINASNSRDLVNFSPQLISSSRRNEEETLTMSQKHVCLWLWCSRRSIISLVRRVRKTAWYCTVLYWEVPEIDRFRWEFTNWTINTNIVVQGEIDFITQHGGARVTWHMCIEGKTKRITENTISPALFSCCCFSQSAYWSPTRKN